ncbi:hypothetical protein Q8A67_017191 [Cirrhinus molitorella]|uniref:Uncharacterized protein n=1 Tax=Cirrhinus molitorella TaxID=172907 RepID=A0AA88TI49_9TELE|nr:hypothetical protein Q8A67_017191 [Cirrhinus molitorella]
MYYTNLSSPRGRHNRKVFLEIILRQMVLCITQNTEYRLRSADSHSQHKVTHPTRGFCKRNGLKSQQERLSPCLY